MRKGQRRGPVGEKVRDEAKEAAVKAARAAAALIESLRQAREERLAREEHEAGRDKALD